MPEIDENVTNEENTENTENTENPETSGGDNTENPETSGGDNEGTSEPTEGEDTPTTVTDPPSSEESGSEETGSESASGGTGSEAANDGAGSTEGPSEEVPNVTDGETSENDAETAQEVINVKRPIHFYSGPNKHTYLTEVSGNLYVLGEEVGEFLPICCGVSGVGKMEGYVVSSDVGK